MCSKGRRVFEHLTPEENLIAASAVRSSRQDMNRNTERVYSYFPRLHERRTVAVGLPLRRRAADAGDRPRA